MTASWCRSVAGPGVLRDSIRPMAPGVSDHDRAHRECSLPHICLPVVLAHGSFDLAKTESIMPSRRSSLLEKWL